MLVGIAAGRARPVGDQVLGAAVRRLVAVGAQQAADVALGMGQGEAPMRQTEHAAAMGVLPGEKRRAAGRTRRRGGKGAPKQHSFGAQPHQIGRRHGVAARLDEAAAVVAVEKENIGSSGCLHRSGSGISNMCIFFFY